MPILDDQLLLYREERYAHIAVAGDLNREVVNVPASEIPSAAGAARVLLAALQRFALFVVYFSALRAAPVLVDLGHAALAGLFLFLVDFIALAALPERFCLGLAHGFLQVERRRAGGAAEGEVAWIHLMLKLKMGFD